MTIVVWLMNGATTGPKIAVTGKTVIGPTGSDIGKW
jgi:hypothetical protein